MSEEDDSPGLMFVEAHEMFIEHVEAGRSRLRLLSAVTIVVAFLLLASYFSQLLLPFTSGTRYVQLDLLSPIIVVLQTFLVVLIFAWLYIGFVNYIFASRLGSLIRDGRALERQLEKNTFAANAPFEEGLQVVAGQGTLAQPPNPSPGTGEPMKEAQGVRLVLLPKESENPTEVRPARRKRQMAESSGSGQDQSQTSEQKGD